MVLVSTKDKRKIYEYLLSEGVICVQKVSENGYFYLFFSLFLLVISCLFIIYLFRTE